MDAFGSNATAMGGIFGRMDAIYGSLECQKSGNLHIHLQAFLQCCHQFTSLSDLQKLAEKPLLEMLRGCTSYTSHVQRKVYSNQEAWEKERAEVEAAWPEFKTSTLMSSCPAYQVDDAMEPKAWRAAYLDQDVEALQKRLQHHVHLPGPDGKRLPLKHCQDSKDPTKCKSGFPRTAWLTDQPFVICPALAEQKGMPHKGKRSMVGLSWGPCNEPNLNGTHPALLAALRCNSDVQPPYRFPITNMTHSSDLCVGTCHRLPIQTLVHEAQINQAAQAGYAADYQNKRLPVAVHECKEWMKAQRNLAEELQDKKQGYVGARLSKRLITDCYARGVCRGAVECTNLTLHAELTQKDPTKAESVKTAPTTEMALGYALRLLEKTTAREPWPTEPKRMQVDARNYNRKKLIDCPFWTAYGGRGRAAEAVKCLKMWFLGAQSTYVKSTFGSRHVTSMCIIYNIYTLFWFPFYKCACGFYFLNFLYLVWSDACLAKVHALSAYEFARHYRFKMAKHPQREEAHQKHLNEPELYHAILTERGINKVIEAKHPTLRPGADYQIREGGGAGWLCLGRGERVDPAYRHDWVVVPRQRPYVPVLYGAQGSKSEEEQAMKLLLLFFPWVNDIKDASAAVPYIGNFWSQHTTTWRQALRARTFRNGFPTDEVKRFVLNFCIVYFLPRELQLQDELHPNSDNEDIVDDLDLALDDEDLNLATLTHVRGAGKAQATWVFSTIFDHTACCTLALVVNEP